MSRIAMPVQSGKVIDWLNGTVADVAVGDVVPMKNFCGIAETDIPQSIKGSVAVYGVWDVPAVSGSAFEVGDFVYWDEKNKRVTSTATDHTPFGLVVLFKAASTTTARVLIDRTLTV